MKGKTIAMLAIAWAIGCLFGSRAAAADAPNSTEAKNIIALVDKAAALIESKKEKPPSQNSRRKVANGLKATLTSSLRI